MRRYMQARVYMPGVALTYPSGVEGAPLCSLINP